MKTAHVVFVCSRENHPPHCMWCDGGLFLCAVCHSFEGATTTDCPGVRMSQGQIDKVYAGDIDYREGQWVSAPSGSCSSHANMPGLPE